MDPHEAWNHYQAKLEAQRATNRLHAAFDMVRRHEPEHRSKVEKIEQLPVVPKRSRASRIAAFVRSHKKSFVGGALAAFALGIGGEVLRRIRGK